MVRLDDIRGYEHVKRAAEVAMSGGHWLLLAFDAEEASALPVQNGGSAGLVAGLLADAIRAHGHERVWIAPRPLQFPLERPVHVCVEVPANYRAVSRVAEPDEAIMERVRAARERSDPDINEDRGHLGALLIAAVRQLKLGEEEVQTLLQLSITIARMASVREVGPAHLAEALSYRLRLPDA